jgi:hypothetical protein
MIAPIDHVVVLRETSGIVEHERIEHANKFHPRFWRNYDRHINLKYRTLFFMQTLIFMKTSALKRTKNSS